MYLFVYISAFRTDNKLKMLNNSANDAECCTCGLVYLWNVLCLPIIVIMLICFRPDRGRDSRDNRYQPYQDRRPSVSLLPLVFRTFLLYHLYCVQRKYICIVIVQKINVTFFNGNISFEDQRTQKSGFHKCCCCGPKARAKST